MSEAAPVLMCSFCARPQAEVQKLIAGPACFICDECVGLCSTMIAEWRVEHTWEATSG